MEITEVKVISREGPDKKLKAYATITIDNSFVVRNIKIIKGTKGLFVAMPSRKMRESCPKCHYKNTIRSKFCNQCGTSLPIVSIQKEGPERQSEHRDIAHPITLECREYIQKRVLQAYEAEAGRNHEREEAVPEKKTPAVEPKPTMQHDDTPKISSDSGDIAL